MFMSRWFYIPIASIHGGNWLYSLVLDLELGFTLPTKFWKTKKPKLGKTKRRYKEMKPPAFYGAGGTWVYPDSWYESFWQELKDKEGWTDKELKQGWRWRD